MVITDSLVQIDKRQQIGRGRNAGHGLSITCRSLSIFRISAPAINRLECDTIHLICRVLSAGVFLTWRKDQLEEVDCQLLLLSPTSPNASFLHLHQAYML
jgi:hypothetical protein